MRADGRADTVTLAQALDQLAGDLARQVPPPLPARLGLRAQAACGAAAATPGSSAAGRPSVVGTLRARLSTARPRWLVSGAVVCALALLGSVVLALLDDSAVDAQRMRAAQALSQGRAAGGTTQALPQGMRAVIDSGFVPVARAERWQRLARTGEPTAAWVLPSDLPRERLATLGLPFDPSRADDRVPAELLVNASGEVLAVRVMQR